jgi:hypothetical protein
MRTTPILWEQGLPAMTSDIATHDPDHSMLFKRPQKRPFFHKNGHSEVAKDRRKTVKFRPKNSNL